MIDLCQNPIPSLSTFIFFSHQLQQIKLKFEKSIENLEENSH